jgi:hypothetical protein
MTFLVLLSDSTRARIEGFSPASLYLADCEVNFDIGAPSVYGEAQESIQL